MQYRAPDGTISLEQLSILNCSTENWAGSIVSRRVLSSVSLLLISMQRHVPQVLRVYTINQGAPESFRSRNLVCRGRPAAEWLNCSTKLQSRLIHKEPLMQDKTTQYKAQAIFEVA